MKISHLFESNLKTFSFEFFPPKDEISAVDFGINIGKLLSLDPSFVSVTYGAGGSTQDRTFALVDYLQNKIGLTTMAHYTCVKASRQKIKADMEDLKRIGIENVFVLRGDPPKGEPAFVVEKEGFAHANDLAEFIKDHFDFCLGGAAYPDVHPEALSFDSDIDALLLKEQAGVEFFNTQLFFDNNSYFKLVDQAHKKGLQHRIIPGIIPLTGYGQLERFTKMSHASIPQELSESIKRYKDDPKKIYQIGMDFSIAQCQDLLVKGAPGIHFYTLNKSRATIEIFETLKNNV